MPSNVRNHPEYPLSEANLEATLAEIGSFHSATPMSAVERSEILEFVRLSRQYAFLEKLIQGDVFFDLPVHMEIFEGGNMSADAQAEAMGKSERDLLDLGTMPGAVIAEALDDRGIKVFRRCHGPEPPDSLNGAFYYAGETGPALLACAGEESVEAAFVLAHEYGHLVMDVNPYVSRFCRWRRSDLENLDADSMEERRADRFARVLLIDDALLRTAAAGNDDGNGDGDSDMPDDRIAQILGVPPALVWRRKLDLGIARSETPPPLPAADPGAGASSGAGAGAGVDGRREIDESRPTDLPERFVNLALAAFAERLFEKGDLGRFLRIGPDRLESFLAWSRIPRNDRRNDSISLDGDEPQQEIEDDSSTLN